MDVLPDVDGRKAALANLSAKPANDVQSSQISCAGTVELITFSDVGPGQSRSDPVSFMQSNQEASMNQIKVGWRTFEVG